MIFIKCYQVIAKTIGLSKVRKSPPGLVDADAYLVLNLICELVVKERWKSPLKAGFELPDFSN